jgi:muramoyltetrapeptide carboxypeptidase
MKYGRFTVMPIIPGHLEYGDTIGIVAPASAPPDPKSIDRSVAALERLGFRPKLAAHVRQRWGFLAGGDRDRAADLMRMFCDARVKAILCVRGGYGSSRLLPLLDYAAIRDHPKALVGYSDITSLHCALLRKCNLVSFHGPMLNSDFIKERCPDFTRQSFLRTLMQPSPAGSISCGYPGKTVSILRRGRVSGALVGGNLSLLCSTLGTPYMPSFKNRILFLEDLDEPPYRFDRMLTQLLNAGLLQQAAGAAIGVNKNCQDPQAGKAKEYRQTLEDVLSERLLPLKVPVVIGLPFGHIPWNATLPFGIRATLDAHQGDLVIEEPAVA